MATIAIVSALGATHQSLAPRLYDACARRRLGPISFHMTDQQPPTSPWQLNPARITLLVLGVLAILMILGAVFGGVQNYEILHEAVSSASSAASSQPAQ